MTKRRTAFSVSALVFLISLPVLCLAHYPWINMQRYQVQQNSPVNLTIGWGHAFPYDDFLKQDRLEELYLLAPDGTKVDIEAKSDLEFASVRPLRAGSYLVVGQPKSGYRTRTTTGYARRSKAELDNAISCSISFNGMKSVLNVGDADGNVDTVVGHPLEIVPLVNPETLKVNDYLPIRVVLNGEPFNGFFNATYAGFSTEEDVFAYTARTNTNGEGRLRILNQGIWLIYVEHQEPYPDLDMCDTRSYRGVLTFQVD
ncbi:DUF4198 domain-containing protein [Desulfonatronum sp. SC1]|uniref:DUF4198 domain-containing protein n=1 Tax=Desulfonatronum sp. SC1 TaxID=2109626 RepID=UPI000D301B9C|nr:DUF4198 domain-containing protein [Desulfonatronum sp. SC1]PTN38768.1 hypothetical protein C6366_02215 [Desulfonatronum sp. SC1]